MKRHEPLRAEQLETRQLLAVNFTMGGGLAAQMAAFRAQMMLPQFDAAAIQATTTNEVPSIDGTGNNIANPEWGSTGEQLQRLTTVEYADGISAPTGGDRPSAREVSNTVVAQLTSETDDRYLTDLVWLWGQFVDHDIDLTENADPAEPFPIEVPQGDPYFDPTGAGGVTIGLNRSVYDEATGDSIANPRQQINQITALLDGSVVYGSDQERSDELRTFSGGKLKTSPGDLLPFNEAGLPNAGGTSASLFLAGDVRANENAALTAMQTLFVREHNRLADEIAVSNPTFTDEQIFQQARATVTAEIQSITYNQYLPALLGEGAIGEYTGYDPSVNPGIANIFSTASYRFGHSMLPTELLRLNADGTVIDDGNLPLANAFFAPEEIIDNGIDSLLLGLSSNMANELDTQMVDDVRNFLFGVPGSGGFDLASLNIQRGRDHGLADYNQARVDVGLAPVTGFSEITSDAVLAAKLEALYGDVNNIDVWVGALAEDQVAGSSMGELNQAVLVDQFRRIRDGDRFWYQNTLSGRERAAIENTTLSDIIQRNTNITGLRENVFYDASVLYYRVAESSRPSNTRVVANGETLRIVNARTGEVLERRPVDEVSKVILVGSNRGRDRFSIDISRANVSLEGGIEVHGGTGRGDVLTVRGTRRPDTISVSGDTVDINGQQITFTDIELLIIKPGRSIDDVHVADDVDARVFVSGRDAFWRHHGPSNRFAPPRVQGPNIPDPQQQAASFERPGTAANAFGLNGRANFSAAMNFSARTPMARPFSQVMSPQQPTAAQATQAERLSIALNGAQGFGPFRQQQATGRTTDSAAVLSRMMLTARQMIQKPVGNDENHQPAPPPVLNAARLFANPLLNNPLQRQTPNDRAARDFLFARHGLGSFAS